MGTKIINPWTAVFKFTQKIKVKIWNLRLIQISGSSQLLMVWVYMTPVCACTPWCSRWCPENLLPYLDPLCQIDPHPPPAHHSRWYYSQNNVVMWICHDCHMCSVWTCSALGWAGLTILLYNNIVQEHWQTAWRVLSGDFKNIYVISSVFCEFIHSSTTKFS